MTGSQESLDEHERRRATQKVSAETTAIRRHASMHDAAAAAGVPRLLWLPRTAADVIRKSDRDRLLGLAAETAFFAVLTLFPAILVVAGLIGELAAFIGEESAAEVERAVISFLDRVLTDTAQPAVDFVAEVFSGSGRLLTVATLLALISLSTAFTTLINTLNIVYDTPETRGWWFRHALGLLLGLGSLVTGAVATSALVIGPVFSGVDYVTDLGLGSTLAVVWEAVRWPAAFAALVLWATAMQHLCPADRHKWRHDIPGGLLTGLLWLAVTAGLRVYLTLVVSASPVLGALGGGLILMTWFYLLTVALLAGGELNAVLAARRRWRAQQHAPASTLDAEPLQ